MITDTGPPPGRLLSVSLDPKTVKGEKFGVLTGILYLSPGDASGHEVCPGRDASCSRLCLIHTAGRAVLFDSIRVARARKTRWLFADRPAFLERLHADLDWLLRRARTLGLRPMARLNGGSDIGWEGLDPALFTAHQKVTFYDYTKVWPRMDRFLQGRFPANYWLTWSRSGTNDDRTLEVLDRGGNISALFWPRRPDAWSGYRVVDGDRHDIRLPGYDGRNVVVGLTPKGAAAKQAAKDGDPFIIRV